MKKMTVSNKSRLNNKVMGLKNKISEGNTYFLTMTVVDWVDVFTRPMYKTIIIDSLQYCQKEKGLKIYA